MPFFGLAYLGLLYAGSFFAKASIWVCGLYIGFSLVTFMQYGWDKACAKQKRPRVPERNLQTLAVLGGWPGAALGQAIFRHKTQKASFQKTFRLCVAINVLLTLAALWVFSK